MPAPTKHVFIVFLLFCCTNAVVAQRSLYQDALALAEYRTKAADRGSQKLLAWVKPFNPQAAQKTKVYYEIVQWYGNRDSVKVTPGYLTNAPSPVDCRQCSGYYSLGVEAAVSYDTIFLQYGERIVSLVVDAPSADGLQVNNHDGPFFRSSINNLPLVGIISVVRQANIVNQAPPGGLPVLEVKVNSIYSTDNSSINPWEAPKLFPLENEQALREAIVRLQGHIKLSEKTDFEMVEDLKLFEEYRDNPFFRAEDIFPDSLHSALRLLSDRYAYTDNLSDDPYVSFPFQKILEGDSTLSDAIPEVGLDDTESYRQRIVTAQNRLEAANTALNNQRKKGGLLDANTIAIGLSDFIAERAQEELNLTFFNRFKENLARDSELTVLFPSTKDLLMKFEISNYKVFLAHARETFNADLDRLGVNLSGVLDLPKYQRLNNDPDVFNLALIYDIANAAYQEKSVEEIILTTHQELQQRQVNLSESINLVIAESIADTTGSRGKQVSTPEFPFREQLTQYIDKVQQVSLGLNNVIADFSEPTGDPLYLIFRDRITTQEAVHNWWRPYYELPRDIVASRDTLHNANPTLTSKNSEVAFRLAKVGGYNGNYAFGSGRTSTNHHGVFIVMSFVDHSRNVIPAFLEGHDYFGYYFDKSGYDFSRQRLKNIPDDAPIEYLARGLERARSFLEVPFEDFTRNHLEEIEAAKQEVELVMREDLNDDLTEDYHLSLIEHLTDAAQALELKMDADLAALRKATGKRIVADRSLVELELLRREYASLIAAPGPHSLTENDDFLQVRAESGGPIFVTQISMQTGANTFLNKYENEWNTLLANAMAQHKLTKTSAGIAARPPEAYLAARQKINAMVPETTQLFAGIGRRMQQIDVEISELAAMRERLRKELDTLEFNVAPELVKARSNARELAKAVELSAHVLFSFRDYEQVYDTLYYQDTQRVEITVQNTDPKSGMVHIFKKDSILVERTPVPGTTEPLTVGKWITRRQFDALRKDKETWNIFLGLLYQRLSAVEDGPKFSARGVATLATQFLDVANEIQETQDQLRFKKGTDPRSVGLKDYFPYIRSTVDLLNIVLTTPVSGDSTAISKRASALGNITEISNQALSLYENIDVREYGNAILNATELLRIITQRQYTEAQLAAMDKDERKRRMRNQRNIAAVFRYGTFMAEMINAQSSEQVKTILKSTTLPPGSSRIKREVVSNFTINAYLGAAAGRDRLLDAPVGLDADALGAALSVPIGMTYSFSPRFLRNRSSFSVHVPLLDLGAITAYRSNPNGNTANVDNLPELEWKNLFSPGAYLIYNFADSPFSLGVGGQYGPQLRELNQANGEPLFLNSWRFPMISATIDVPFYNLHTGPRKIVVR